MVDYLSRDSAGTRACDVKILSRSRRARMRQKTPRIAILGAGPIGLEAALTAAEKGYPFTVYEAEDEVAAHVKSWGHVSLFTPWQLSASEKMCRALAVSGQQVPDDDTCPTGSELIESVLRPVAELPQIQPNLRLGAKVQRIGRRGLLKHEEIGTSLRAGRPFRLLVVTTGGEETFEEADIVLDCTGNSQQNPLGDGGIPAIGERALAHRICRRVPDLIRGGSDLKGRTVLLVGAGHSAQTALRALGKLMPATQVIWVLRRENPKWGLVADDPLPERDRLTRMASSMAAEPPDGLRVVKGAVVESLESRTGHVEVTLRRVDDSTEIVSVDRILSLTGQVGNDRMYRQLQVHECYATSGPMKLAASLMSDVGGDCMTQTSKGAEMLQNPEPGFFILGSKSYGRRNDFLMRVGWQQVDEIFGLLEE